MTADWINNQWQRKSIVAHGARNVRSLEQQVKKHLDKSQARLEALRLSTHYHESPRKIDAVLQTAERFYDFVTRSNESEGASTTNFVQQTIDSICKNPVLLAGYINLYYPTSGKKSFVPYPFQYDLLQTFASPQNSISLVARQNGKSLIEAVYAIWFAGFQAHQTVLLIGSNYTGSANLLRSIKGLIDGLPDEIRPVIVERSATEVRFDNGSRIEALAVDSSAVRGKNPNLIIFDEFAFVGHGPSLAVWRNVSMLKCKKIICSSAPPARGGAFCEIWDDGDGWLKRVFDWRGHPDRSENFESETVSRIGQASFDIQFGCKIPS